jgi:hypothetical protein
LEQISKKNASSIKRLFAGEWKKDRIPELWDGHTAQRIVKTLMGL